MDYTPYGTDISERMVEYSRRNLEWLSDEQEHVSLGTFRDQRGATKASLARNDGTRRSGFRGDMHLLITQGDATNHTWAQPIDAVACEVYLGQPMSNPPAEIKLKQEKQQCGSIILGFLKNLSKQIAAETPVTIAVPAWLRLDGTYERLNLLDEIGELGYNVISFKNLEQNDLLYHRAEQIVAREIIVLRKK